MLICCYILYRYIESLQCLWLELGKKVVWFVWFTFSKEYVLYVVLINIIYMQLFIRVVPIMLKRTEGEVHPRPDTHLTPHCIRILH